MALCEQCGSIQIVVARPERLDKLLALVSADRPFVCRRCGWRGRRDWSDSDLRSLLDYGFGGAEPDPTLVALDGEPPAEGRHKRKKKTRRPKLTEPAMDLGLTAVDLDSVESVSDVAPSTSGHLEATVERQVTRKRRNRSRRREIIATIAVTSFVMFLVVVISLTGSCSSAGPDGM